VMKSRVTGNIGATGPITVVGTCVLDGTVTASDKQLVTDFAATLGGSGIIHRKVFITTATTLSPGPVNPASFRSLPGTLTVDSLSTDLSSTLRMDLDTPGVAGGATNDLVNVLGNLNLQASVTIVPGVDFHEGHYTLITYGGTFNRFNPSVNPLAGYTMGLDFTRAGEVGLNVVKLPEPATLSMLSVALGGALFRRRRSRGRGS